MIFLIFNMLFTAVTTLSYWYFLYNNDTRQWLMLPVVLGGFFSIAISNSKFLETIIDIEELRKFALFIIVYLPLFSFGFGFYNAENIFIKKKFDYFIDNKDTLKYLGNTGDYFIFTSMDNSKNYFLNTKKIDTLVLLHRK